MPDRIDVVEWVALELITARLIESIQQPQLNDRTCFLTVSPLAVKLPKGGSFYVSVAPGGGQYDDGLFEGGGEHQVTELGSVDVTAYTRIKLDSVDQDHKLLTDGARGLLKAKRDILKALSGFDLTTLDGEPFLREFLAPRAASKPEYSSEMGMGWLTVTFGVSWDWDLGSGS